MKAEIVHVTDHAALRWEQRVLKTGSMIVRDVVEAIKDSKVIKKNELLPFNLPRHADTVYAYNSKHDALFVLDPVNIEEFRLVTVISSETMQRGVPKNSQTRGKNQDKESFCKIMQDTHLCESQEEQRDYLLLEKQKIEKRLAKTPKSSTTRPYLVGLLANIENKLNKAKLQIEQKTEEIPVKGAIHEDIIFQEILLEIQKQNKFLSEICKFLGDLKFSIEIKR